MEIIHKIGRRKASVARIFMSKGKGKITVNGKDFKEYFPVETMQYKLEQPFNIVDLTGKFDVKVNVNGGGTTGQAEAIRLAISRALCELDPENRVSLKPEGMLTRDARVVERKKPGQKKARKKFQWVKR
jgi:small subunit ribosomal protein S9